MATGTILWSNKADALFTDARSRRGKMTNPSSHMINTVQLDVNAVIANGRKIEAEFL